MINDRRYGLITVEDLLNDELLNILLAHQGWYVQRFGDAKQDWYFVPVWQANPE